MIIVWLTSSCNELLTFDLLNVLHTLCLFDGGDLGKGAR